MTERFIWASLALALVAVIGTGIWSMVEERQPAVAPGSLPVLGEVPDFRLIERSERAISRADLAGRPWVADFIFTTCAGVCPVLSSRMARLQRTLRDAEMPVRLVSFSVDPARDTPGVLRDYARRYEAGEEWWFLTGEHKTLYDLIGTGFRLSVADRDPDKAESGELITHSDRFVLVDSMGRIRGYYRGTEEDLIPRLLRDIATLQLGESETRSSQRLGSAGSAGS